MKPKKHCTNLKKIVVAGFGALVLIASAVQLSAQDAVIPFPNAGFESGENGAPTGWNFSNNDGGTGSLQWSEKSLSGQHAARVLKTNRAGYSMLVSDFIPVEAGKNYEVKARFHIEGRSRAKVYFMVSQYADDKNEMRFPNYFSGQNMLYSGAGWGELKLTFPVREGSARVKIHLLHTLEPIDISWDDLQVRELAAGDTGYKPRREEPKAEGLPPLEPVMEILKKRQPVVAERRVVDGRARFFIDGKETEPALYVGAFHDYNRAQIADFTKAGVKLFLVPLTLGRGVYGDDVGPWLGKNQYDWKEVDERLWRILRVNPEANIIFYMATDPYLDWAVENPDSIVRDQDDKKVVVNMHPIAWGREPKGKAGLYNERWGYSYVSNELRRDTAEALRQLIRYVQSSLPGKAVAGYHIAGGNDGQFFPWDGYSGDPWDGYQGDDADRQNYHFADYSPASQIEFRNWLRRKYKTETALRAAWKQPNVSFASAAIPSGERRIAKGIFFDAKTDEDIADYNRFFSVGIAETIQGFARVIKEETGGKKFTSTYWEDSAAGVEGHFATGQMLATNDLDFLSGPTDYGVRMPGDVGEAHSIWGSYLLHNRIWVSEQDFRSWLAGFSTQDYDDSVGRAVNATDHNNMVRRESGMMLAFGQGTWWYDMSGGWFADAGIMSGVTEARKAFTRDLSTPGRPRADVAVFVSERTLDYIKEDGKDFRYQSLTQQIRELNQSGVPYQLFLQNDLDNPKLPDFKCYIFLNAQNIEPNEWRAIQKLKRDKKLLCFIHAPGTIKPKNVSASTPATAIEAVTGIKVRAVEGDISLAIETPTATKKPLPINVNGGLISTWIGKAPAFIADDAKATTLGVFEGGGAAVAMRDFGSWKSVFFGGIGMSDKFFNALAKQSGAWVAGDAGDVIYANQNFFTIHAMWDGGKDLRFLQPSKVTDLTTGQIISTNAKALKLDMKRGQTRWFYLQPQSETP
jgi:hypothetical protein